MKFLIALCLIISTSGVNAANVIDRPTYHEAHIQNSPGGGVDQFLELRDAFIQDGTRIHISGYCASACTLFLAADACVYPNTRLGFHAPFYVHPRIPGARLYNDALTEELLAHYPPEIREWLTVNGGLQPSMLWLEGEEMLALVPLCEGTPIV